MGSKIIGADFVGRHLVDYLTSKLTTVQSMKVSKITSVTIARNLLPVRATLIITSSQFMNRRKSINVCNVEKDSHDSLV